MGAGEGGGRGAVPVAEESLSWGWARAVRGPRDISKSGGLKYEAATSVRSKKYYRILYSLHGLKSTGKTTLPYHVISHRERLSYGRKREKKPPSTATTPKAFKYTS
jgi:hypothetical protein